MIECYYREYKHHSINEPFCNLDSCVATKEQIIEFQLERRKYLNEVNRINLK